MDIWIEQIIVDNMVINGLLLYFTAKITRIKVGMSRILLGAAVGTGFSLITPMLTLTSPIAIIYRLVIGAAIVFTTMPKPTTTMNATARIRRATTFYATFIATTFAFGGAIYAAMFAGGTISEALTAFMDKTHAPMGAIIGGIVLMVMLARFISRFITARAATVGQVRDCIIKNAGIEHKIVAFHDTGNRLTDPETGAPVVMISPALFMQMFPDISVQKIAANALHKCEIKGGRYINITTVSGKGKVFTFTPENIGIGTGRKMQNHTNVRLGLSSKGFRDAVHYDALLHATLA